MTDTPAPKHCQNREDYDELLTVRNSHGGKFLAPITEVPAFRTEVGGRMAFYVLPKSGASRPTVGGELTDQSGAVWVVTDARPSHGWALRPFLVYVQLKKVS